MFDQLLGIVSRRVRKVESENARLQAIIDGHADAMSLKDGRILELERRAADREAMVRDMAAELDPDAVHALENPSPADPVTQPTLNIPADDAEKEVIPPDQSAPTEDPMEAIAHAGGVDPGAGQ